MYKLIYTIKLYIRASAIDIGRRKLSHSDIPKFFACGANLAPKYLPSTVLGRASKSENLALPSTPKYDPLFSQVQYLGEHTLVSPKYALPSTLVNPSIKHSPKYCTLY